MTRPLPPGVFVEDDAEDEPTIWLHRPDEPDAPIALLCPGNLGRHGRELLWDYIVRDLPTYPPIDCSYCGRPTGEWPARECEEPHQHDRATYACDCGDVLTVAQAVDAGDRHRRCNLIGSRS